MIRTSKALKTAKNGSNENRTPNQKDLSKVVRRSSKAEKGKKGFQSSNNPRNSVVTVRLDSLEIQQLRELASTLDLSVSETIRYCINSCSK
jgi:hypothetical protein